MSDPEMESASEPELESAPEDDGFRRRTRIWIAVAMTSLAAYPLSVGPVMWICRKLPGGAPSFVVIFYTPLETLYRSVPIVKMFYDAYFKLLGVR